MSFQKILFKTLDTLLPSFVARKVYKVMSNPRVHKLRDFEEKILDKSKKEIIDFKNFKIQTYTWGKESDKVIFLIHGWEGQAGNFGALIDILLEKGYYIKAFDGPSHGKSSKGSTSMFTFAELVEVLLKKYKPTTIISHSFGSVTSMFALSKNPNIPIGKWLLVTTPHNFKSRVEDIKNLVGVTNRTMDRVVEMIETDTGVSIDLLNVEHYGGKVKHVKEILIVHSKSDKIIPIESSRITNKNIPHSKLVELDNLGHYSILWSDELKEIVAKEL
ncbi:MAG: hypothetical protein DWQ06_14810 [Calditrichaeota bacterium]|nr:MAG: hypothetical protein DWQ06_14810 [Calditrichota bacterium]